MASSSPDLLFGLRNNFYLGAYQAAINNSDVPNLSQEDAIERDSLVYRSYIALGSYQLVINEIDSSAPTALQAVKLLAMYLSEPGGKEAAVASLREWLSDSAIASNPILRLIAGIIYTHEQDYNEALKHTHSAGNMELLGGSKIQEAYLIFQDFSEKYQQTGTILNGKAVCCMHMGHFDEAESLLLEALNKASA
ncbi:Coatomer subunit epsilon [Asimina triloba]